MYDIAIIERIENSAFTGKLLRKFPFARIFTPCKTQFDTITQVISWARTSHVWVISNNCNYDYFDFEFRPDEFQTNYIHVWNNSCVYDTDDTDVSDTFLIPVTEFQKQKNISNLYQFKEVHRHTNKIDIITKENNKDLYDTVFISNNEPFADQNYNHLVNRYTRSVLRVNGINDRTQAFQAAANFVSTEYFFSVPAKLRINDDFAWNFSLPNSYYNNKHYIFYAKNPVNNLVYGHMALVLYNKKLVLETVTPGLDFTLSKPHSVVPVVSGVSNFNLDPLVTYRTAFREVIKLLYYQSLNPTSENEYRIQQWTRIAQGLNAQWCLTGAGDAKQYFEEVDGEYNKIIKTYSWQWVDNYAQQKGYNLWN